MKKSAQHRALDSVIERMQELERDYLLAFKNRSKDKDESEDDEEEED